MKTKCSQTAVIKTDGKATKGNSLSFQLDIAYKYCKYDLVTTPCRYFCNQKNPTNTRWYFCDVLAFTANYNYKVNTHTLVKKAREPC